ncbi:MAG: hypothetical protein OEZ43_08620 [Gammaproteobacteria bacterium]|nr:hypothetical protein [Gammaproteobacteria bacterium]
MMKSKFLMAGVLALSTTACLHETGVLDELLAGNDVSSGSDIVAVDGSKFTEATTVVEVDSTTAMTNVRYNLVNKLAPAVGHLIGGTDTVLTALDDGSNQSGDQTMAKMLKGASSMMGKLSGRVTGDDPIGMFFDEIVSHLEKESHVGNVITWKVKTASISVICVRDEYNPTTDMYDTVPDKPCEALATNARLVHTLAADNAGVFVLTYKDLKPIGFGYSPDEWYLQGELSGFKSMVTDVETTAGLTVEQSMRLPANMHGVVRLGLKDNADGTYGAGFGVIEDVIVTDATTGTDVHIAKAPLVKVLLDTNNSTIKTTLGVAAVNFMGTDHYMDGHYDDTSVWHETEIESTFKLVLAKLTGEVVINSTLGSESIKVTGLSVGPTGIAVDSTWKQTFVADPTNVSNSSDSIKISAADITGLAQIGTKTITTDVALDVKVDFANSGTDHNGPWDNAGSFHVTAAAGTAVSMDNSYDELITETDGSTWNKHHEIFEIKAAGPLNITAVEIGAAADGTDITHEVSLAAPNCYDMDGTDGPVQVDCANPAVLVP